jgi:hypothetical protein
MGHKNLLIGVTGFGLVIVITLFAFGVFLLYESIDAFSENLYWAIPVFILLSGLFFCFTAVKYYSSHKILLTELELKSFGSLLPPRNPLFVKVEASAIKLSQIEEIFVGSLKYFLTIKDRLKDERFNAVIRYWYEARDSQGNPLWLGAQNNKYLYVRSDSAKSFFIDLQPFPQKKIDLLILELKKKNISVLVS